MLKRKLSCIPVTRRVKAKTLE